MPPKKKHKNSLHGSSKMARLLGASRPAATVKSLRNKSNVAGAPCVDAAIATPMVPLDESPPLRLAVDSLMASADFLPGTLGSSDPSGSVAVDGISPSSTGPMDLSFSVFQVEITPVSVEEACAELVPVSASVLDATVTPPEASSIGDAAEAKEVKNYTSLLKASCQLEELGTPTEHISGVAFVLIQDENITPAKEEFKEFIYARFHGDWPTMGRIIGVVNALWARAGPRIFVHNVGEGEFLMRISNVKTREMLLGHTCWNVAGFPMFIAPWSPEFTPEEAPITSAVIPIELREVPCLLFNKQSLSRLATAVGKPIYVAPKTKRTLNFKVAKLYVKVDLTKPLPNKIISGFSNGKENEISVSYLWLPLKFDLCKKYVYLQTKCRFAKPGSDSTRKRSVSPAREGFQTRNRSRPRRAKVANKVIPHVFDAVKDNIEKVPAVEEGVVPAMEEGEVPAVAQEPILPPVEGITVGGSIKTPVGDAGRHDMPDNFELEFDPGSTAESGNMLRDNASSDVGNSEQSGRAPDDDFFLVYGRKSGHKAKKSI
ncbi:hypothetical protein DY000_02043047 [Brassica cretica]|uniref:DUF4283 domain-containing protein n=1 Tax=Brassica cretica TaxID=69181 RepID=A0ABQ7B7A3_BRACR|nr:hypothetical protein DY000_02043047 [Brassica cretica]